MLTVEVKSLIRVMKWIRRISFIICLFVLLFFVHIGYKGGEYQLNNFAMVAIMLVPLLILFTSGRWWESLTRKKFIGISIKREKAYENAGKSGHIYVDKKAYSSEGIHI